MTMTPGSSPRPPSAPSKSAEALRLRSLGLSNKQIAAVLNVPVPSARRLVSEGKRVGHEGHALEILEKAMPGFGAAMAQAVDNSAKAPISHSKEDDRSEAVRLYLSGMTCYEVAEKVRYAPSTVKRWLHRAGVMRTGNFGEHNRKAKLTVAGVQEMRARHMEGETQKSLAEDFGVSPSTANAVINEQTWTGESPIFTRRCRNRHCIERFVPVNAQHWYHEPACREAADLWSPEDILREEGSLSAGSHPLEMVKRAFGQKNQLLRKVTALTSQREYLAYEVSNFYRDNPEYRWPPLPSVPHDDGRRGERALVVQLSDWQIGKLENGIGIDEMRKRIERIKAAIRSVVERQRAAGYAVNHVTLSWGGDMIEGCYIYGGQNVTGLDRSSNTHRITTQIRVVAHMKAEVAFDVASYVENVDNEDVGGNHARPNGKNDFADPEDNFDLLAAHWASDITQNEPRIRWHIHEDWWGAFDSLGHRFVSFHGDQWRGPFTKLEDLLPKWTANDVFGKKPEVVLTHHRHDFATLRVGGMFVCQNGTIDGGSKWYLKAYGKSSPPTQVIHVVSERRATESLWPVDFA